MRNSNFGKEIRGLTNRQRERKDTMYIFISKTSYKKLKIPALILKLINYSVIFIYKIVFLKD
jgi:hypothetical protein